VVRLQALALTITSLLLAVSVSVCAEELATTAGDKLDIKIANEAQLSRVYTVDQDGNVTLDLIGKVPVKDLTTDKVREELAKRLAKFVRDPQVSVEYKERAQVTVGVTGALTKPGAVKLKKGSRLTDAISLAGGVTADADQQKIILTRRGKQTAETIDLLKLAGNASMNITLEEGDAIYIPQVPTHTVQVLGAVNKPGGIVRKNPLTVQDAVEAAGGLTMDAVPQKVQILRKGAVDPEMIDLDAIKTAKAKNVVLQDGDTLTVAEFPKIPVKVFGYVTKSGDTMLKEGSTVLDAIAAAGGYAMEADKRAVFVASASGDITRFNLDKLDSPELVRPLKSGDRVMVPQHTPRRYAVMGGGVTEPGIYSFPTDPMQKVYVTDALASGKGVIDRAKKKSIFLIRKSANGERPTPIEIDFEALIKKKDPKQNYEILPEDVLFVDAEIDGRDKPKMIDRVLGIAGAFIGF